MKDAGGKSNEENSPVIQWDLFYKCIISIPARWRIIKRNGIGVKTMTFNGRRGSQFLRVSIDSSG